MKNKYSIIPSLFTILNLSFGVLSIHTAIFGNTHLAAWFIIWAVLCDGMDGKLARWQHCETEFGLQLDSLSDLVSFGVAPALLVSVGLFKNQSLILLFLIIFYVYAGAFRLARFNSIQKGDRAKGYQGVPIPVAGMTLSGLWLFYAHFEIVLPHFMAIGFIILLSLLMISKIPYAWPRLMFHEGRLKAVFSVGMLLATACMAIFPAVSIFPLLAIYIVHGIIRRIFVLSHDERAIKIFSQN